MTIEIPLTQGQIAIVDDEDSDLSNQRWCATIRNGSVPGFYAKCKGQGYLHRVILARVLGRSLKTNEWVDHINRNTLDNRRTNLRLTTPSQNHMNRSKNTNNTSGFKGVSFNRFRNVWTAQIRLSGKVKNLGRYDTAEEAAHAYDAAAREHFGEFGRVNFPQSEQERQS